MPLPPMVGARHVKPQHHAVRRAVTAFPVVRCPEMIFPWIETKRLVPSTPMPSSASVRVCNGFRAGIPK